MASSGSLFAQLKEKTMKPFQATFVSVTFAFALLLAPAAWAQSPADHIMVMPEDLKWADVPSLPPGAKIAVIEGPMNEAVPFTVRLKLPANYKVPAHWHPAIEHVTVISGTFNMGTGDKLDPKQTKPLSAGSVAIMQPKTNHFAWTEGETIIQTHGVGPWVVNYVNPADDPRKK
jgi:quercetin dioxygenase-like cupin family protein